MNIAVAPLDLTAITSQEGCPAKAMVNAVEIAAIEEFVVEKPSKKSSVQVYSKHTNIILKNGAGTVSVKEPIEEVEAKFKKALESMSLEMQTQAQMAQMQAQQRMQQQQRQSQQGIAVAQIDPKSIRSRGN